jgi:hypothetical protein
MYRRVETSLWEDEWFTELSSDQKLAYLYFVTGPTQKSCGVCKVNLRRVSFDTGIANDRLPKAIEGIWPHLIWHKPTGHVAVLKFMHHQDCGEKWRIGAKREYDSLAVEVRTFMEAETVKANDSLSKPIKAYPTVAVAVAVTDSVPETDQKQITINGVPATPLPSVPNKPKKRGTTASAEVTAIFEFWRDVWDYPKTILTPLRKKAIQKRLDDGHPADMLYTAIVGFKFDTWVEDGVLLRQEGGIGVNDVTKLLMPNTKTGRDNVDVGYALFNIKTNRPKALRLLPPEIGVKVAQSYMELYSGNVIQRLVGMVNGDDKALHDMSKATLILHAYEALARTADPKADYSDIRERMLAGKPPTPPAEFEMPEEVGRLIADQYGPPVMMEVPND